MPVNGPTPEKSPDGTPRWRVRYDDGDKKRSRTFKDESLARQFAAELREKEPKAALPRTAETEATTWRNDLSRVRAMIMDALDAGQLDPLQAGRVLAQISSSAAKFVDQAKMEEAVKELQERFRIIHSAQKHGIRNYGRGSAAAGRDTPDIKVHKSRNQA